MLILSRISKLLQTHAPTFQDTASFKGGSNRKQQRRLQLLRKKMLAILTSDSFSGNIPMKDILELMRCFPQRGECLRRMVIKVLVEKLYAKGFTREEALQFCLHGTEPAWMEWTKVGDCWEEQAYLTRDTLSVHRLVRQLPNGGIQHGFKMRLEMGEQFFALSDESLLQDFLTRDFLTWPMLHPGVWFDGNRNLGRRHVRVYRAVRCCRFPFYEAGFVVAVKEAAFFIMAKTPATAVAAASRAFFREKAAWHSLTRLFKQHGWPTDIAITREDARTTGYCKAGIAAWVKRHRLEERLSLSVEEFMAFVDDSRAAHVLLNKLQHEQKPAA